MNHLTGGDQPEGMRNKKNSARLTKSKTSAAAQAKFSDKSTSTEARIARLLALLAKITGVRQ